MFDGRMKLGPGILVKVVKGVFRVATMRRLVQRWTDEDIERLKQLHASGASVLRASVALKRNKVSVMNRARQLGIPFPNMRGLRGAKQMEHGLTEAAARCRNLRGVS